MTGGESATLEVIFESDELLVLNKPSGLSVLRDRASPTNLLNEIRSKIPQAALVHRIDKGTSGVFLVAKSDFTRKELSQAFNQHRIRKFYVGVVCGHMPMGRTLVIDLPLRQGRKSRYRVAGLREEIRTNRNGWHIDSDTGYPSITRVRVLRHSKSHSLVLCQPLSGRTHQIRVHLSWVGFPLLGDTLYGTPRAAVQQFPRLALHCHRLVVPRFGAMSCAVPHQILTALE